MTKQYLPFVGATDASTSFGHGACIATLPLSEIRTLGQLNSNAGDHVVLGGLADDQPQDEKSRLGPRHILNLDLAAFKLVLCVEVSKPSHINLEEARSLLRFVRWVLRAPHRYEHRLVILLDSRVVIGGAAKGRSGSVPLNRLLRQLAALTFAGGLILHLVFIPSEHNPGDFPSRGGPATWPKKLRHPPSRSKPPIPSRLELYMLRHEAAWKRLLETGMVTVGSSASSSTSWNSPRR